jgi:hypothetical protein
LSGRLERQPFKQKEAIKEAIMENTNTATGADPLAILFDKPLTYHR